MPVVLLFHSWIVFSWIYVFLEHKEHFKPVLFFRSRYFCSLEVITHVCAPFSLLGSFEVSAVPNTTGPFSLLFISSSFPSLSGCRQPFLLSLRKCFRPALPVLGQACEEPGLVFVTNNVNANAVFRFFACKRARSPPRSVVSVCLWDVPLYVAHLTFFYLSLFSSYWCLLLLYRGSDCSHLL